MSARSVEAGRERDERRRREAEESTLKVAEIDLRRATTDGAKMLCTVHLNIDFRPRPWLTLGTVSLLAPDRGNSPLPWLLSAEYADGSTDHDHSGCYAVRLPLVGVGFEFTSRGGSHFHGYIAPKPDDFHIATPDWDPGHMDGSYPCKDCKEPKHRICPEGAWLPPSTPDLYKQVAMRQVQIWIGPDYAGSDL